ncbi:MAG: hypothetical protein P8Q85_03100 [Candidatus Poseidoniaceae archaeon]|nr:hypothetical protein [Candidatus Poseidoniaceae archaeon]MDG1556814.1 hypothetical protein [Candidatus Poseidoniaceae archaeon]MDG1559257.1 hypothetical protein [Candidatus Poseidoniaceae archaeon]
MADVADVSSPLMDELSALGPIFGIVLILGGVFLMLRGHERLQYVAGATGAGMGYVLAPTLSSMIPDTGLEDLHVMIILMMLFSGIMLMTIQMSIYLMASMGTYIMFSWSFHWLDGQGMEIADSEFITNVMAIVAFFSVIWVRKQLPMLVSALLGSIATLSGLLVLNGQPLANFNPQNTSTLAIVLVLFIVSVTLQSRAIKRKHREEDGEEEPPPTKYTNQSTAPRTTRTPSEYDLPDLR